MKGPIFDTHAHYCSTRFDPDREELLARLPEEGVVGVCECATHSGDAALAVALAHKFPYVWAAVGMAPLFEDERVVAVGECGLDHHWPIPEQAQLDLLEAQLKLARELDKPIILHDREAHATMYELLRKYKPKGILHCYSGSADDAEWLTAQGLYLGFGGSATFKGARRALEAAKATPPEQLLLETDCPYMAPVPFRGKRNDSSLIAHTAAVLARELDVPEEELLTRTAANARRVFGLEEGGPGTV